MLIRSEKHLLHYVPSQLFSGNTKYSFWKRLMNIIYLSFTEHSRLELENWTGNFFLTTPLTDDFSRQIFHFLSVFFVNGTLLSFSKTN